jgi:hypothetical protein
MPRKDGKKSLEKKSRVGPRTNVNTPEEPDTECGSLVLARFYMVNADALGIVVDCTVGDDDLATVCDGQLEMDARPQDRVKDRLGYGNRVGISVKQQLNGMQEDMARAKEELESKIARVESELAQVKSELALLKQASTTYTNIRRRFLAMFKRNFFLPKMKQSDWDDIHRGNLEARATDLISDAKLFMDRRDFWLFEDLYGVSPLGALRLGKFDRFLGESVVTLSVAYTFQRVPKPAQLSPPTRILEPSIRDVRIAH